MPRARRREPGYTEMVMSTAAKEIIEAALKLDPTERAHVVQELLESISGAVNGGLDPEWIRNSSSGPVISRKEAATFSPGRKRGRKSKAVSAGAGSLNLLASRHSRRRSLLRRRGQNLKCQRPLPERRRHCFRHRRGSASTLPARPRPFAQPVHALLRDAKISVHRGVPTTWRRHRRDRGHRPSQAAEQILTRRG